MVAVTCGCFPKANEAELANRKLEEAGRFALMYAQEKGEEEILRKDFYKWHDVKTEDISELPSGAFKVLGKVDFDNKKDPIDSEWWTANVRALRDGYWELIDINLKLPKLPR